MFNFIKSALLTGLLTASTPALALDLNAMSVQEKDQFGQQVREYLLQNPDIIMEVFSILEQRQQQDELEQDALLITSNLEEIQNDGFSWEGGNPDGDITLVEFLDYKCAYCRKAHGEVANLIKADGNIRLVVKEYPILSEDSYELSRAAIATLQSLGPDAYKKMYNQFIEHDGPVNDQVIAFLAKKVGLDGQVIITQMAEASVDEQIKRTRALGEALNVSGTPTFIFNDQIVRGYVPESAMKDIVAELRRQTQ